ncbi:MAG: hypothetical protein ACOCVA_07320 [Prolixibacteraceae bacterium]
MSQDTFIYTLPQWIIFSAVAVIVYGWVEKKKIFRVLGAVLLLVLGVFAAWSIYAGYFAAHEFFTPQEIASTEMNERTLNEIPFQARLLPAYWSFILSATFALPAIYFDWKNKKPGRLFIVLAGLVSLFGFFVIVGELNAL